MSVQAMFNCQSKTTTVTSSEDVPVKVNFMAAVGRENEPWSKYTPAGQIDMTITNPAASDWFKPGVKYLVTFEEAGD